MCIKIINFSSSVFVFDEAVALKLDECIYICTVR